MSSFRFIHAADIHLDSPLKGLADFDESAVTRLRTATREALRNLVGHAIEESVDFLIIAGDLYDGDWRDYQTGHFFVSQMGRLNQACIQVYLLYGNHDAASQITRRLELPGNVHVFSSRKAESFHIETLEVALHGQSFNQPAVTENLVPDYPAPMPGAFNIGVLHTALGGMGAHENYAPCSIADLTGKGYDYWALGHVHGTEILHQYPHIVFPGNLQGRHIRETGAKGARLVSVEDGSVSTVTFFPCDVVRWAVVPVQLAGIEDADGVTAAMTAAIAEAVATQADERLLACRIELHGRAAAHGSLVAMEEQWLAEARAAALGLGSEAAWIEKVVIRTEAATCTPG